mgnify:CR=1 FL=1
MCITNDTISDGLFQEYGVNRGLRDVNGKGVLTGLTRISKIVSFKDENGKQVPCDGELWYRGYNVKTLIKSIGPNEFGFEKAAYLLLFGELPDQAQLDEFCEMLGNSRTLPTNFTRDVIMKAPSKDIMNSMTRSILTLAAYDPYTTDSSIENNIRQCMQLIANFPMIAVYGYHAYNHYENDQSMYIHRPDPKLSTAENFLRMLRADNQYTELEARVLDMALILHMEHGGGNNSTFTTRVVTSAWTARTLIPYLLSSSAFASSSFLTLRPVSTRLAPSLAYAVAIPYPMDPQLPSLRTARPYVPQSPRRVPPLPYH